MKIISKPLYKCPECGIVFRMGTGETVNHQYSLNIHYELVHAGLISGYSPVRAAVKCPMCQLPVFLKDAQI